MASANARRPAPGRTPVRPQWPRPLSASCWHGRTGSRLLARGRDVRPRLLQRPHARGEIHHECGLRPGRHWLERRSSASAERRGCGARAASASSRRGALGSVPPGRPLARWTLRSAIRPALPGRRRRTPPARSCPRGLPCPRAGDRAPGGGRMEIEADARARAGAGPELPTDLRRDVQGVAAGDS